MDWKQSIENIFALRTATHRVRPLFRDGASEEMILAVEESLELKLPHSLCSLLVQTDGLSDELELSPDNWIETGVVVYSVEQLLEVNRYHRDQPLYRDRNIAQYCLISTPGVDGIQFCIRAARERFEDVPVFAWYPDETEEKCMGQGLFQFLDAWCTCRSSV